MSASSYSGGEGADQSWHHCPSFARWDFNHTDTLPISRTHTQASTQLTDTTQTLLTVDGYAPVAVASWPLLTIYFYYNFWSSTTGKCRCFPFYNICKIYTILIWYYCFPGCNLVSKLSLKLELWNVFNTHIFIKLLVERCTQLGKKTVFFWFYIHLHYITNCMGLFSFYWHYSCLPQSGCKTLALPVSLNTVFVKYFFQHFLGDIDVQSQGRGVPH